MDIREVSLFRLRRAAVFAFLFCLVAWPAGRVQAVSLNDLPPSLQTKVLSGDLPPELLEKLGQSPHQDFKSDTIEKSSSPPPATPNGKLSADQNEFRSGKQGQQTGKPSKIELQYRQSYGLAAPDELTAPDQINEGQNSPGSTSLPGSAYGQTAPTGTEQGNGPGQQQSIQSSSPVLTDELCQYGYDIFSTANPKPSMLAVPDGGYILGPGDRLRIRIWGSDEDAEFTGTIDRDGTINVPKIGIVPIAGVKFSDAEGIIKREAEKYIQGINVNVSLEELRSLEIYVVGSVDNPGLHLVPAFSTVLDALVASGGIPKTGSLRKIELYRGKKLLRSIDLYDLLLKGDRKADIVLENRDVIFVPRLRKTAAVVGSVAEEGIFELNGEKTVGDLLALSGGLLPQADSGRIYLRRYLDNRKFAIQDIDTAKAKDWQKIPIKDGDLLELRSVQMKMPQTVVLEGHVWQPDVFRYEPGMTLSKILTSTDLLKPGAVMDFALLHRYDPTTTRYQIQRFPLDKVFSGEFDQKLRPHDRIEILSRKKIGITEPVTVQGGVWQPGQFPHRPGLTLADALALAGGPKFGARLQLIGLSRQQIENGQVSTKHFSLDLKKDGGFLLQPYDYVQVPMVKDAVAVKTVTISGEVKYPGIYRIGDGERLSDLIARAGGFLPDAYFFGAKYTSEQAREIQQQSIDKMVQELEFEAQRALGVQAQTAVSAEDVEAAKAGQASLQALLNRMRAVKAQGRVAIKLADLDTFKGSAYDFELQDGDALFIPKQPNFVTMVGSVYSPNAYLYVPNKSVEYYLAKSGGPMKTADEDHIYLLRANGEVISKEQSGRFFSRFDSQKLMPGDTLVVPEDLEHVPRLRLVKDVSDIVFKIATTAGIAIAIL